MMCLFGYMDFMIIKKWLNNYRGYENEAPGIINLMTGMFLEGGRVQGRPLFTGHVYVNNLMAVICAICVPWMLCVKPVLLYKEN